MGSVLRSSYLDPRFWQALNTNGICIQSVHQLCRLTCSVMSLLHAGQCEGIRIASAERPPAPSIDLLDSRAAAAACTRRPPAETTSRHTALRHVSATAGCLVHLHHDRVHDTFKLFLLCLELVLFGQLILVEPIEGFLYRLLDLLLVVALKLVLELLLIQRVPHGEAIVLQAVLCFDLVLLLLILSPVLLRLLYHAVDLGLGEATLFIRDGDLVRLPCRLVLRRNVQDAVCVDVKCDLNLRDAAGGWWDAIEVELPQQVVVFGHRALALKDLNEHPWLVVRVRCEGLCLFCRDG